MKNIISYLVLICIICSCNKKAPYNFTETYSYRDKNPFGSSVAKVITENYFPLSVTQHVFSSFSMMPVDLEDSNNLYISISKNFYPSEDDVQNMLNFMYNGNTVFISASNFDTSLTNRLYCSVVNYNSVFNNIPAAYQSTGVKLSANIAADLTHYSYYFYPFSNYFSKIGVENSRHLSYNDTGEPNGFVLFGRRGKFILHCEPRAFSNYFLLTGNNYQYFTKILQIIPSPTNIYWDSYYQNGRKSRKPQSGSAIDEIFKYPSLRAAFWIFLGLLLLYILFNIKRRQRIIPVIKPNENSSVAFTETISRLYLQQKDHKGLSDKMIIYFYDHIKTNYFIQKNTSTADNIIALSRKSGVPEDQVSSLFQTMEESQLKTDISEQELLVLNHKIQQFFKSRK